MSDLRETRPACGRLDWKIMQLEELGMGTRNCPAGCLADESIEPLPIGSTVIMRLSIELATSASITLVYAPTNVNELYCTTVPSQHFQQVLSLDRWYT